MSGETTTEELAARISGLRHAMEVVLNSAVPDDGRWSGIYHFFRNYFRISETYVNLYGDENISRYNLVDSQYFDDMSWSEKKGYFDSIYLDAITLEKLIAVKKDIYAGPIYNLFVSSASEEWLGEPFEIERNRCLSEYTDPDIIRKYGKLDDVAVVDLIRAPCIFAHEAQHRLDPKIGFLKKIERKTRSVRVEYEILAEASMISYERLDGMKFDLDIEKLELYRRHWSVKPVNLVRELALKGLNLSLPVREIGNPVDISRHVFDVALSFPGESRKLVEEISQYLEGSLGPNRYFYDNNYVSQLARPSMDTLLQGVYARARLDVVFIGENYQAKDWCGVEFRAIREIIKRRENNRVMIIKTDDGNVDGIFETDGYVDARRFSARELSEFICQRLDLIR